ncbi:hypothetical protein RHMOL_Rhmol07G0208600 [Rhododendron molle]|uniref:Uncharacterized protein n=1 Tax=Rhododendron molle TaxID=49168 RepID=A0ACC0N2Q9_RHOML|nr:hypothetical protein RHMOL_Rhmol07G0208600 [Rhododendron molle]
MAKNMGHALTILLVLCMTIAVVASKEKDPITTPTAVAIEGVAKQSGPRDGFPVLAIRRCWSKPELEDGEWWSCKRRAFDVAIRWCLVAPPRFCEPVILPAIVCRSLKCQQGLHRCDLPVSVVVGGGWFANVTVLSDMGVTAF